MVPERGFGQVLDSVMSNVLNNVMDYCSKEETRARLESKVLAPAIEYLADRFSWGVRLFQAVALLVLIQTLILLWLLFREVRRAPSALPAF